MQETEVEPEVPSAGQAQTRDRPSTITDQPKGIVRRLGRGTWEVLAARSPGENSRVLVVTLALLCLWLVLVILVTLTHEYWRDEVRAWSLARQAVSPLDLFPLIRHDGHPMLWYLLLYLILQVVDSPLVLPAASILIASTAAILFLWRAPFPLWIKVLFLFSALPFYEYAVMARNYGLGMLLVFACAALYRRRAAHPWRLAACLALLANTSAHYAILAGLLTGVWVWDTIAEQRTLSVRVLGRSLYAPLGLVAAGLALSFAVTSPAGNTILTGVRDVSSEKVITALAAALFQPSKAFNQVLPPWPSAYLDALVFLAVLGLLRRPPLFIAALVGQIAFGLAFSLVFPGYYRHQGTFLIFLLALYWIAGEDASLNHSPGWLSSGRMDLLSRRLFWLGMYVIIPIILLNGWIDSAEFISRDIQKPMSSSRLFGRFLGDPQWESAVIAAEPDYRLESLPYYAGNPIYLPREGRYSPMVSWTTDSAAMLSLAELLHTARRIQAVTGRPVLIALGHFDLETDPSGRREFSYNKVFTWTPAELADFYRSTRLVAGFTGAVSDENYLVYELLDR